MPHRHTPTCDSPLLRPIWIKLGFTPLRIAALLFISFAALRAYSYFGADAFKSLPMMISFLAMWFVPPIFLTPEGGRRIGLLRPRGALWLPVALLAGSACAYSTYLIGYLLFDYTENNWFMNIGFTYMADPRIASLSQLTAFVIFSIPAILFSPIGEELFFRGFLQEAIQQRRSKTFAMLASAFLFAAIHIVHHGLLQTDAGLKPLWLSGFLWFSLMFATSIVFTRIRFHFQSIWAGALAHAAFNLTMNYTIFYSLFVRHPMTSP